MHRYLYAFGNPTVFVDPDGRIALLREFADFLKSKREGAFEAAGQLDDLAGDDLASRAGSKVLAAATGLGAGLIGLGEGAVRGVNFFANAAVSQVAPDSELAQEAVQELDQSFSAIEQAVEVVREDPVGVGGQLVNAAFETTTAAIRGDTGAIASVAGFVPDALLGAKGLGTIAKTAGRAATTVVETGKKAAKSVRKRFRKTPIELGNALEKRAKAFASDKLGETVIESQFRQGAAQRGFDFVSFTGKGRNAQLIINEAKNFKGGVPTVKFTTFGLGKSGIRTFRKALKVAEQRILKSGLDSQTERTLIRQLRRGGARIRLIGGKRTRFTEGQVELIEQVTGFKTEIGPLLK